MPVHVDDKADWISASQAKRLYGILMQRLLLLVVDKTVRVRHDRDGWPTRLYCRADIEAYVKRREKSGARNGHAPTKRAKVKA